MDHIENTTSNSSFTVACTRCLAMALVLLRVYEAVAQQWLFLWSLILPVALYCILIFQQQHVLLHFQLGISHSC
jgi:hypothetical protein